MNQQGQPFCFIDEEVKAQRGKMISQGHTALTLSSLLGLSGCHLSLFTSRDSSYSSFHRGECCKAPERGRPSSGRDVLPKSKALEFQLGRVRSRNDELKWNWLYLLFCFLALFLVLPICDNCLESELEASAGRLLRVLCEPGSRCVQWGKAGGGLRGRSGSVNTA